MLGASVYLSTDLNENKEYLHKIKRYGGQYVFTSLHIPEEDHTRTLEVATQLAREVSRLGMKLMVDISSATLELFQIDKQEFIDFLKKIQVACLRIDYGFSVEEIAALQKEFEIVLNASTIDEDYAKECVDAGLILEQVIVCHNYYPRKDTGLSKDFFLEKNKFLKSFGFKVLAFIAGNEQLRGPVYEGLVTIEDHRKVLPLYAYMDLKERLLVDEVIIGDKRLAEKDLQEIQLYHQHHQIRFACHINEGYELYGNRIHRNRRDVAQNVVRSENSRMDTELRCRQIDPEKTEARPMGTITVDNSQYLRYMGELQVTRVDLPPDERVNVIGHVDSSYCCLLPFIQSGTEFILATDTNSIG